MPDDVVGVVGFMAHEDDGFVDIDVGGDGEVEVGGAGAGVVCAADPHSIAAALDLDVAVDEDGCAVGFEWLDDVIGSDADVVISEDGEALRSFEGGEDFRGDTGGLPSSGNGSGAAADEVSGEEDEFGIKGVGLCDHLFEEPRLGVLLEVDVGELNETETDECVGEVMDRQGAMGDFELVPAFGAGIGGNAEAGRRCSHDEVSARDDARCEAVVNFACGGQIYRHTP